MEKDNSKMGTVAEHEKLFNSSAITYVKWLSLGENEVSAWAKIIKQFPDMAAATDHEQFKTTMRKMAAATAKNNPDVAKVRAGFLAAYKDEQKPLNEHQIRTSCRVATKHLSGGAYLFFMYWLFTENKDCFNF